MKVPAGLPLACCCWLALVVVSTLARPQELQSLSLDAKDADPNSEAFKKALAEATKQARLELGVRDSEELGVASGDLANLFGKRRRKRQLFGGGNASSAQTVGNALSTGAGLFGSTLGIFLDTVWQAYQNFLRGTETVGLLAIDQIEDLTAARGEDATTTTTPDPLSFRRR